MFRFSRTHHCEGFKVWSEISTSISSAMGHFPQNYRTVKGDKLITKNPHNLNPHSKVFFEEGVWKFSNPQSIWIWSFLEMGIINLSIWLSLYWLENIKSPSGLSYSLLMVLYACYSQGKMLSLASLNSLIFVQQALLLRDIFTTM